MTTFKISLPSSPVCLIMIKLKLSYFLLSMNIMFSLAKNHSNQVIILLYMILNYGSEILKVVIINCYIILSQNYQYAFDG